MPYNQGEPTKSSEPGYRVRLRCRVMTLLNTEEVELTFEADSRTVKLVSEQEGQALREASWLVFDARGFPTEEAAITFGNKLKFATAFASLCCRLGVDVGHDLPTSGPGKILVDLMRRDQGIELRANVHGLDVFPDRESTRFLRASGTGTVLMAVQPFLGQIGDAVKQLPKELPRTWDAVLLLNAALINPEPLAKLVLAISAVEMLGQSETYSQAQHQLITRLMQKAEADQVVPLNERKEVAEAVRRVYKISLRQGVFRILDALALSHMRRAWDDIYRKRSAIFHGTAKIAVAEYAQLANDAITLCGCIVLSHAATEGVELPVEVEQHFPGTNGEPNKH